MPINFDHYYDPPEEPEEPCKICHYGEGDCTCPECTVCGDVGNPVCINIHMNWSLWPHFKYEVSERARKAQAEAEAVQADWEAEVEEEADRYLASLIPDDEPRCSHEGYEDKNVCGHCGQLLAGPFEEIDLEGDDDLEVWEQDFDADVSAGGFPMDTEPRPSLLDASRKALHWMEETYGQPNHYIAGALREAIRRAESKAE